MRSRVSSEWTGLPRRFGAVPFVDASAAVWVTSLETSTVHAHGALGIQPPTVKPAQGGASLAIVSAAKSRAEVEAVNDQADHISSPLVVHYTPDELVLRAARS
jgi:hypothetical protein